MAMPLKSTSKVALPLKKGSTLEFFKIKFRKAIICFSTMVTLVAFVVSLQMNYGDSAIQLVSDNHFSTLYDTEKDKMSKNTITIMILFGIKPHTNYNHNDMSDLGELD